MADLKSELLFEMSLEVGEVQDMGGTPHGTRRIIPVTGGTFSGSKLQGTVLPGGADWAMRRADGATVLDVRVTLRTDDGSLIYMSYRGMTIMSPEIRQRILQGETVHPSEYYFRTAPVFETGAEKYDWLNRIISVGVGERTQAGVAYTVYVIL